MSSALADQPAAARNAPIAAAVHAAVEPTIHAHPTSVPMASGLPGSTG